jgi:hypothetical protein
VSLRATTVTWADTVCNTAQPFVCE